jgi:hypothetical protein
MRLELLFSKKVRSQSVALDWIAAIMDFIIKKCDNMVIAYF